jgi:hypothetical protein
MKKEMIRPTTSKNNSGAADDCPDRDQQPCSFLSGYRDQPQGEEGRDELKEHG